MNVGDVSKSYNKFSTVSVNVQLDECGSRQCRDWRGHDENRTSTICSGYDKVNFLLCSLRLRVEPMSDDAATVHGSFVRMDLKWFMLPMVLA